MIYEGQVQYLSTNEEGKETNKKESLIINEAISFADAEKQLYEAFEGFTNLDVIALKRSKIKEVANGRQYDDDKVFVGTLVDTFLNEDGSETELKYSVAFFSKNMDTAHAYINEYVKQGYDMSVVSLKLTKFIDVL